MATVIHDEIRTGIGRVTIHDYGHHATSLGRYQVQRVMKLANGRTKITYGYRHQKPAAISYATRWLDRREAILREANVTITPRRIEVLDVWQPATADD